MTGSARAGVVLRRRRNSENVSRHCCIVVGMIGRSICLRLRTPLSQAEVRAIGKFGRVSGLTVVDGSRGLRDKRTEPVQDKL